jgi:hypothetical protein
VIGGITISVPHARFLGAVGETVTVIVPLSLEPHSLNTRAQNCCSPVIGAVSQRKSQLRSRHAHL